MIKDILKTIPFCKIMLYSIAFYVGFTIASGCSALEVLPGLCYTDKDGTYLCPEIMDPPEYDRGDTCRMIYGYDPEQWRLCMDPDNDKYYDPYWEQRKKIKKSTGPTIEMIA